MVAVRHGGHAGASASCLFIGTSHGPCVDHTRTATAATGKPLLRRRREATPSGGGPARRRATTGSPRCPGSRSFNIDYFLGVDGISMPLVLLTTACQLPVHDRLAGRSTSTSRGYCMLFLLLETGMLGTFLALDFFLFYIFWEVMLLPMYFLIGVWGGPRREYAAIKFFLYTLLGSVFILIALLGFYFTDVRDFASPADRSSTAIDRANAAAMRAPAPRKRNRSDGQLVRPGDCWPGPAEAAIDAPCTQVDQADKRRSTDWARRSGRRHRPRQQGARRHEGADAAPRLGRAAVLQPGLPVHDVPAAVHRLRHQGAGRSRSTPGCPMPTSRRRRRSA